MSPLLDRPITTTAATTKTTTAKTTTSQWKKIVTQFSVYRMCFDSYVDICALILEDKIELCYKDQYYSKIMAIMNNFLYLFIHNIFEYINIK